MKKWYQSVVVPQLLNSVMKAEEFFGIREEVLKEASGIVLEIGVGPGYNFPIYRNISKLYALEPSEELIKIAKTRATSLSFPIEFLHSGAEKIPLEDNSVDTVVSTWTLCSVFDIELVLRDIRRVLRSNGRFIFYDHGASPKISIHVIQKILTFITKHFTGNCHYDREIEKLIKKAGFGIQKIEYPHERFKFLAYNYKGIATKL